MDKHLWKISFITFFLILIFTAISCYAGNDGRDATGGNWATDFPVGFATLDGGTTGGAGNSGVTASTLDELKKAISSNKLIYIDGTITQPGGEEIFISNRSNLSIIGVADRAELDGIGVRIQNSRNIIIRNLTIHHVKHQFAYPNTPRQQELTSGDAIGVESSHHIWVDHCTFYNAGVDATAQNEFKRNLISQGHSDSEAEEWEGSPKNLYDGLLDVKGRSGYLTFSWNKVWDSWKTSLVGANDSDKSDRKITYHHNWFKNCNSRLPMYRGGVGHIYNNYYSEIFDSAINCRAGASLLIENNYFDNVKKPIQSSDGKGGWKASGNNTNNGGKADLTMTYAYTPQTAEEAKASVQAGAGAGKLP